MYSNKLHRWESDSINREWYHEWNKSLYSNSGMPVSIFYTHSPSISAVYVYSVQCVHFELAFYECSIWLSTSVPSGALQVFHLAFGMSIRDSAWRSTGIFNRFVPSAPFFQAGPHVKPRVGYHLWLMSMFSTDLNDRHFATNCSKFLSFCTIRFLATPAFNADNIGWYLVALGEAIHLDSMDHCFALQPYCWLVERNWEPR